MSFAENMNLKNSDGNTVNPATSEDIQELTEAISALCCYIQALKTSQGLPDSSARIRANVETGSLSTVSTVTTVGTVNTVTNQGSIGGKPADTMIFNLMNMEYATKIRANINVT